MMQVKNRFSGEIIGEFDIKPEANLREADLREANLRGANLWEANLREADLREADLREANLRGANLWGADLREATLGEARINDKTKWPAPTMVLLVRWVNVSDKLCIDLMRYDAANHPNPTAFDDWARGGKCPYDDINIQRCANFRERKELWQPLDGPPKTAYELMVRLFEECLEED